MRTSVFWVLFFVVWIVLVFFDFSIKGSSNNVSAVTSFTNHGNGVTMTSTSRKLKENFYTSSNDKGDGGNVNLDDYVSMDPVPSSTASIRSGPIQHGTPLIPCIPEPSPPKHGAFP